MKIPEMTIEQLLAAKRVCHFIDTTDHRDYGITEKEFKHIFIGKKRYCHEIDKLIAERAGDISKALASGVKYKTFVEVRDLKKRLSLLKKTEKRQRTLAALRPVLDKPPFDFYRWTWRETVEEISKIEKKLAFLKDPVKFLPSGTKKTFDIARIKEVPIDNFVEINRAGFFRVRKEERTASAKWFKEDNTWVDFGGDNQKHDVIDLIMILKNLDFIGACDLLTN